MPQHFHDALAQHLCLHHAAVEEYVRRTGEATGPAPDLYAFGAVVGLLRKKAREVFRDRGVCGIGQAQLLKAYATLARRHLIVPDDGEEAFREHTLKVFAAQLRLDRAADELGAFA